MWTLTTHHRTTVFYDPVERVCRHAEAPLEGWSAVHLWSDDQVHGLLVPDCDDAADHVKPVRIRLYDKTHCVLLSAKCGLDERLLSAIPAGSDPWAYIEWVELTGPWEVVRMNAAPGWTTVHEKSLRAFSSLIAEQPSATDIVNRQADARAVRWYLAFQDLSDLDSLGREAVKQRGCQFIWRLGATARLPAVRHAYQGLADWIEHRNSAEPLDHLGPDFDVFEPWPTITLFGNPQFEIDFEIVSRMRQHIEPRKRACILATLRNEGPYILEWLAYHMSLGFEHFFLYTNDNEDGSDDLLAALVKLGHVTLITNDVRNVRPQYKAYGHAFKALPHILDYEWALVIDGDEFLVLAPDRGFSDIRHYLDWICTRPADAIAFNWLMFRSFGIEEADLNTPVTRRFMRRADKIDVHIKSMLRPRYFMHSHAHYGFEITGQPTRFLNSNGDTHLHGLEKAYSTYPAANAAWINHYYAKSDQEYCGKIARRPGDMHSSQVRSLDEIEQMLRGLQRADAEDSPVEDSRILNWLEAAERRAAKILADPRVRAAHEASVANLRDRLEVLAKQVAAQRARAMSGQMASLETSASASASEI